MFIHVLLVHQVHCMGQNTGVLTKLYYECFNKLVKNKIFRNLFRMLRIERNFYMVSVIEFIKVMTQEQRLLSKLLMKCFRLLEDKN